MRYIFIIFIRIYQAVINPSLRFLIRIAGLVETPCRYPISCSCFAIDEFQSGKCIVKALKNIGARILSCQDMWWKNG